MKGTIMKGAMPWSHRWIGNPILTGMLNVLFRSGVSDAHCGLRAIRRDAVPRLGLSSTGMEFASEMVIKASKRRPEDRRGADRLPPARRRVEAEQRFATRGGTCASCSCTARRSCSSCPARWRIARRALACCCRWRSTEDLGDPCVDRPRRDRRELRRRRRARSVIQLGLFARTYAALYLGEAEPMLESIWRRFRLEHGLALGAVDARRRRDHRRDLATSTTFRTPRSGSWA